MVLERRGNSAVKKIFSLLLIVLLPVVAKSQIVNNSGTTAADSLSVPFYLLDSAGNMTATAANDSLFLVVFYPSGAESFRDTVAHGNSLITTVTVAGYSVYSWKMAIADIDGTGKDGLYSYLIWVKDHTGAALATPHKGYFQLYQANDYNVWATRIIDSLQAIIDTLQLLDNWVAREATIASEVGNIDGWNPITDNDSLIIDKSALGYVTAGDSVRIDGSALAATTDAITSATIASGAIDATAMGTNSIHELVIASNAIGADEIAANAIGASELADSSITEGKIKSSAFHNRQFQSNVFDSDKFDGTVREEIWNIPFTSGAVAAGTMWDSLNNQSYVQGTASSLDSAFHSRMLGRKIFGIASGSGSDSISLSQRKVVSWGGFVDSNKTEQGGISGANRTWNVYVFDTSGADTPIPGANVDVQLTNGTVKSRGSTDASGLTTFTVTDGSWVLVSQETGYVLNNLNKTILANSTDTIKGFDIQVGTPSSPALCRVYGYVYSVGAVPEQGAGVAAFLPAGVARSGSLIISPYSVTTIIDSLGYFYLDLIRSDSLVPSGTMYDFIINRKDGTIVHKRVSVPDQASWLLQW